MTFAMLIGSLNIVKTNLFNPIMKRISLSLAILTAAVVIYYAYQLINAHFETPNIKARFLNSSRVNLSIMAMPIAPKIYNIKNNKRHSDRIKNYLNGSYTPKGLFDIKYDKG